MDFKFCCFENLDLNYIPLNFSKGKMLFIMRFFMIISAEEQILRQFFSKFA